MPVSCAISSAGMTTLIAIFSKYVLGENLQSGDVRVEERSLDSLRTARFGMTHVKQNQMQKEKQIPRREVRRFAHSG